MPYFELRENLCCGGKEITGLKYNPPETIMHGLACRACQGVEAIHLNTFSWRPVPAFYIFADASSSLPAVYAEIFQAKIEELKLGNVIVTGARPNPNTGNQVRFYLWEVDREATIRYFKDLVAKLGQVPTAK